MAWQDSGSWNSSQVHILPFLPLHFLIPSAASFSAVTANNMLATESELFSTGVSHMFIIENVFAFSLQHTAYTDAAWLWIHSWERRGTGRWSERKLVRSGIPAQESLRVSQDFEALLLGIALTTECLGCCFPPSRCPVSLRHGYNFIVIATHGLSQHGTLCKTNVPNFWMVEVYL